MFLDRKLIEVLQQFNFVQKSFIPRIQMYEMFFALNDLTKSQIMQAIRQSVNKPEDEIVKKIQSQYELAKTLKMALQSDIQLPSFSFSESEPSNQVGVTKTRKMHQILGDLIVSHKLTIKKLKLFISTTINVQIGMTLTSINP